MLLSELLGRRDPELPSTSRLVSSMFISPPVGCFLVSGCGLCAAFMVFGWLDDGCLSPWLYGSRLSLGACNVCFGKLRASLVARLVAPNRSWAFRELGCRGWLRVPCQALALMSRLALGLMCSGCWGSFLAGQSVYKVLCFQACLRLRYL